MSATRPGAISFSLKSALTALCDRQEGLQWQLAHAPATQAWIQCRDQLQQRIQHADKAADPDYALIGRLGLEISALEKEGSQLKLLEGDFMSLADRHAAVVQETSRICAALVTVGAYAELATQAAKLAELRKNISVFNELNQLFVRANR